MEENEIRQFISPKHFASTVDFDGSQFEIEVETPDLSGAEASVWGDWGPMYTFAFDEPRTVRVRFRCEASCVDDTFELWVPEVKLNSPMQWERRQEQPFYVEIVDATHGLVFDGYLDPKGRPVELRGEGPVGGGRRGVAAAGADGVVDCAGRPLDGAGGCVMSEGAIDVSKMSEKHARGAVAYSSASDRAHAGSGSVGRLGLLHRLRKLVGGSVPTPAQRPQGLPSDGEATARKSRTGDSVWIGTANDPRNHLA